MARRSAGTAATAIARPAIQKLLKGRSLEFKPRGHADRPVFKKVTTNNYADVPKPFKNDKGRWVLHVKRHEGWNQADYRSKVDSMRQAGQNGQLRYVKDTSAKRTGAQGKKRDLEEENAVREAIQKEDAGDLPGAQAHLDERLRTLDRQEADHIIELQIDGKDELANLKMIDATTNHGMGGQLRSQIVAATNQGMQPGDLVEIVEVPGTLRNR
ncbi:hypothetical protein [Glycomyces terrestris]|uniref:Uncharacterized protein n=1 Tax=Glycomyces terrestris TaxID=2493553 RepID=A0A426V4J2_9ACTN|nr:hypothetical protein [Glycomyces terrestris]RRS01755.1 hypothetical protein EIW28_03075 [Glycomyces terrestris]